MSSISQVNLQTRTVNRFSLQGGAHDSAPLLNTVFREYTGPAFAIRFWDNSVWYSDAEDVGFRICLRSYDAWNALSSTPDEVSLGGKYITGEIDVEGDLFLALRTIPLIEEAFKGYLSSARIPLPEFPDRGQIIMNQKRATAFAQIQ